MIKRLLTASTAALIAFSLMVAPIGAQTTSNGSGLGQAIKACNMTAKDSLKTIRDDFKAGSITKDERNSKVKDVEKTRTSCIKDAQKSAEADRKAKLEAKKAELKAKMEARKAEARAKVGAQKAKKAAKSAGKTGTTKGI